MKRKNWARVRAEAEATAKQTKDATENVQNKLDQLNKDLLIITSRDGVFIDEYDTAKEAKEAKKAIEALPLEEETIKEKLDKINLHIRYHEILYPPRMSFRINRHLRVENYSSTTNLIQAYIAEYPQKIQA
jgi:uncharacterized FlaG/YvyC family protein